MRTLRITVKGKQYTVEVGDLSKSPIPVIVNGESFEVELEREAPRVATPPVIPAEKETRTEPVAVARERTVAAVPGAVTAPMPGKIVAVRVKEGDHVALGQELCVLEAMKMEQSIRSGREGVIKAVRAEVGKSVSHGDLLFEFE